VPPTGTSARQVLGQPQQRLQIAAAQRRDDLEADQRALGLRQMLDDLHRRLL
jgi:hypothetical protein